MACSLAKVAVAVAQLDLHREAGGVADALNRRRRQHQRARLHDGRDLVVQAVHQRAQILAGSFARIPILQDDVGDAGIGKARAAVERGDAGDGDHLGDARRVLDDIGGPVEHLLGPLQRGAIRQLNGGDQIALVLDRQEAGRHPRQAVAADPDQDQREGDRHRGVPAQEGNQPRVAALDAVIDVVETAIEEVALFRRHRRPQPQRALRRLQRRRVDGGQQRGRRDHQRELRVDAAR